MRKKRSKARLNRIFKCLGCGVDYEYIAAGRNTVDLCTKCYSSIRYNSVKIKKEAERRGENPQRRSDYKIGKDFICGSCGSDYIYTGGNDTTVLCKKCYSTKIYKEKKHDKIEHLKHLLGGKCCECGFDKYQVSLHFHHLDPTTKKFNITASPGRRWAALYEEAQKCVLLCANCHTFLHMGGGRAKKTFKKA